MRHRTINKAAATILLCTTVSCCYSSLGVAAAQTSGSGGGETEYPYRLFRQSPIQKKARIRKRAERIQKTQNAPDHQNVDTWGWGSNSNSWSKGESYYDDEDCNEEYNNYWGSKASKKGKGSKKSKTSKKSKSSKNKKGKGSKSSKCIGPIGTDSPTVSYTPLPTMVPIVTPMPTRRPRTRRPTPRPVEPIPVPPTFKPTPSPTTRQCAPLKPNPYKFEPPNNIFPKEPWSTGGDGVWAIDESSTGSFSIKSPNLAENDLGIKQISNATLEVCADFEGGPLVFNVRASVLPPQDLFIVYVDGVAAAQLADVNEFDELGLELEAGPHIVDFSYQYNIFSLDPDSPELENIPNKILGAVWIDFVRLGDVAPVPPAGTLIPTYSPTTSEPLPWVKITIDGVMNTYGILFPKSRNEYDAMVTVLEQTILDTARAPLRNNQKVSQVSVLEIEGITPEYSGNSLRQLQSDSTDGVQCALFSERKECCARDPPQGQNPAQYCVNLGCNINNCRRVRFDIVAEQLLNQVRNNRSLQSVTDPATQSAEDELYSTITTYMIEQVNSGAFTNDLRVNVQSCGDLCQNTMSDTTVTSVVFAPESPTVQPTPSPTISSKPSAEVFPTISPSVSMMPTNVAITTNSPSYEPSLSPTNSSEPSSAPSFMPSTSAKPSISSKPSGTLPTVKPTADPTQQPSTLEPTLDPTVQPTPEPTLEPTLDPTQGSTLEPTQDPTSDPTQDPTQDPTFSPTMSPTISPTTSEGRPSISPAPSTSSSPSISSSPTISHAPSISSAPSTACIPTFPGVWNFENPNNKFPNPPQWTNGVCRDFGQSSITGPEVDCNGDWGIAFDETIDFFSLRSPNFANVGAGNTNTYRASAQLRLCSDFPGGNLKFQVFPGTFRPFDRCILVLDGTAVYQTPDASANLDWITVPSAQGLPIGQGAHLIEWQYEYNPFNVPLGTPPSVRRGAVWIDNVNITSSS